MSLDVEAPPPPSLSTGDDADYEDADVQGDDYRRGELQEFLENGAWETAVEEWAESAGISEEEFAVIEDLDLFSEYDFFWDSFAGRVGYHAPGLPENWRERDLHPDVESWGTVSGINAALTELGQTVCDVLKEEYIDWDQDYDAPDDLPDF